jgi:LysR family transcriptional activator of nhaA
MMMLFLMSTVLSFRLIYLRQASTIGAQENTQLPIGKADTSSTWLNYHHLLYFWTVVREGSVSAAARKLRLAQSTVSGQLKALEAAFGLDLFRRTAGKLVLSEAGSHVYSYADEIFVLGAELRESLARRSVARRSRLVVGIADVMPKLIVQRLLEPAMRDDPDLRLLCYEDRHDRLLADLALHDVDVVLSDTPAGPADAIRAFSRLLGESAVSLFAKPKVAERLRRSFPRSMEGTRVLLPIDHTSLRRALMKWFDAHGVRPTIRGEFQDSALLTVFGQLGEGVFAAPTVIEDEIRSQHRVEVVARLEQVTERFYAITVDRRVRHPAVTGIYKSARTDLFRG